MALSPLLLAAAASLAAFTPCKLTPLSVEKTQIPGCLPGSGKSDEPPRCAKLPDSTLLCECLMPGPDNEPTLRVGLRKGGDWVSHVDQDYLGLFFQSEYSTADLDGDGKPEVIAAIQGGVSNGLAISSWDVYIWNGASLASPPQDIGLQDFGVGSLVQRGRQRGCQILQTQWLWGREPKRGDGEYFVGCLHNYRDGRIQRASGPCYSRRLLFSFQKTFADDRPETLRWLQDRRAMPCEPGRPVLARWAAVRNLSGLSLPSEAVDLKCVPQAEATAQSATGRGYPEEDVCHEVAVAQCRSDGAMFSELWFGWPGDE